MRKNVGSQIIGAEMLTAADGSAFTGTVTVYVTGDGGTQAIGSVGSGVCTHEGNGFHTYTPAQAETNYNHVAFTFIGTAAVPATIQVYPVSYDPTDTVRMGLTALPNAAADAAGGLPISDAGGLDLDAILADTNELQTDWTNAGRLDAILDTIAADTTTDIPALIATAQADLDILTGTDGVTLATAQANYAPATAAALVTHDGKLDTVEGIVDNILTDTAEIGVAGAGLTAVPWNASWDAEVESECTDALNNLTLSEMAQGAPGATPSLPLALNYLYRMWRNKTETTATELAMYDDAGTTKLVKSTIGDDATTFTKGEFVSGA